jgi:hypothetical protein
MTNSLAFNAACGARPAVAARAPRRDPHVDRPLPRTARRDPHVDGSLACVASRDPHVDGSLVRLANRHGVVVRPTARVTLDGALTAVLMIAVAFIGAAFVDACALASMAG